MFFYSEAESNTVDPYFSNVSLLIKADGDNNSTVFTDSSNNNLAITPYANAKISTDQSKFGGSSVYFDGNADSIAAASSDVLNFGNSNFTIEMWVYATPTTNNGQKFLFGKRNSMSTYSGCISFFTYDATNNRYKIAFYSSFDGLTWGISNAYITNAFVSVNSWTHLAFVRNGTEFCVYVDGTKYIIGNNSGTVHSNNSNFILGATSDYAGSQTYLSSFYSGYMDDIRITKGVARYTANFTPPDSHPTT